MKTVFVTVGTSAIENEEIGWGVGNRRNHSLRQKVINSRAYREQEPARFGEIAKDLIAAHGAYWERNAAYVWEKRNYKQTSAELISTMHLLRHLEDHGQRLEQVVLLSSDTNEGEIAAAINAAVMKKLLPKVAVSTKRVIGLDAKPIDVTPVLERYMTAEAGGGEAIVNITGGFKGTIPPLTFLAMRYNWDLWFQHESADRGVVVRYSEGANQAFDIKQEIEFVAITPS